MLNFCLPEPILKKIVIELQNKKNDLEKELNDTDLLINSILSLQSIDIIDKKEVKLPGKNNKPN